MSLTWAFRVRGARGAALGMAEAKVGGGVSSDWAAKQGLLWKGTKF